MRIGIIKEMGFVPYQLLEEFAYKNFYEHEKSTLRAKCRSIWDWYNSRDWTIPVNKRERKTKNDEELLMTRRERALSNSKIIKEQKKKNYFKYSNWYVCR